MTLSLLPATASATENGVAINETNFPDALFREKVAEYDKNNDGVLSDTEISNIIGSNPEFLITPTESILKLITKLKSYGFTLLNILFDSNPYILNLEVFEIENYINNKKGDKSEQKSYKYYINYLRYSANCAGNRSNLCSFYLYKSIESFSKS